MSVVTLHLHANTFNECILKKTKILFLIRGSHESFLMKNLPIINQIKHSTKGAGKVTRWKGPKSWEMKESSKEGGWQRGRKKRYKMKRPKSWQMKNHSNWGGW
jgi:hypothetical protein